MEEKQESVPFLPNDERAASSTKPKGNGRTAWLVFSVGSLLNIALFFGAVVLYMKSHPIHGQPGPLRSDIKDAGKAVQYEIRTFTGALKWDRESGNMYREQDYSTEYFGPPSEKLDAAWKELLRGKSALKFRRE